MKSFKRCLSVILAVLMIFSSVSLLGSTYEFDGQKRTLVSEVKFFRKDGTVDAGKNANWVETTKFVPGEQIKATVYLGTDFVAGAHTLFYVYSKNILSLDKTIHTGETPELVSYDKTKRNGVFFYGDTRAETDTLIVNKYLDKAIFEDFGWILIQSDGGVANKLDLEQGVYDFFFTVNSSATATDVARMFIPAETRKTSADSKSIENYTDVAKVQDELLAGNSYSDAQPVSMSQLYEFKVVNIASSAAVALDQGDDADTFAANSKYYYNKDDLGVAKSSADTNYITKGSKHTVTYYYSTDEGENFVTGDAKDYTAELDFGDAIAKDISITGYTCSGTWYSDSDCTSEIVQMPNKDCSVYTILEPIDILVNFYHPNIIYDNAGNFEDVSGLLWSKKTSKKLASMSMSNTISFGDAVEPDYDDWGKIGEGNTGVVPTGFYDAGLTLLDKDVFTTTVLEEESLYYTPSYKDVLGTAKDTSNRPYSKITADDYKSQLQYNEDDGYYINVVTLVLPEPVSDGFLFHANSGTWSKDKAALTEEAIGVTGYHELTPDLTELEDYDLARDGYSLAGWSTNDKCAVENAITDPTKLPAFDAFAEKTTIDIYAVWDKIPGGTVNYNVEVYEQGTDGTYPTTATKSYSASGTADASLSTADVTGSLKDFSVTTGFELDTTSTAASYTVADGGTYKIYYKRQMITVTYQMNGKCGSADVSGHYVGKSGNENPTTEQVMYGTAPKGVTVVTDTAGYTFKEWTNAVGAVTLSNYNVTEAVTFTASYKKCTYTISFKYTDKDGNQKTDTTLADITGVEYGKAWADISLPTTAAQALAPTGYVFDSWTNAFTTMPASAVTLIATYKPGTYNYSFVLDEKIGDKTVSGTATGTTGSTTFGETIVAPTVSGITTGYEFVEWRDADGKKVEAFSMNAEGVTYYAHYQIKSFTITFTLAGKCGSDDVTGTVKSGDATQSKTYGATVTAPTVSAPDGYVFDYWKNSVGTKVETIPNATADATYTAVYKYATYTISFKYKNADGDKTDITAIENVAYKTAFSTLTGIPSSETMNGKDYRPVGKKFTGWTIDSTDVTSTTTMPAKAVTLVAAYQDDSYSYSFVLDEKIGDTTVSGTATGATGTATYGGTIVAPTVSNVTTGYTFVEWRDADGKKVTTFSMNAEGVTYYAHYELKKIAITFTLAGKCGSDDVTGTTTDLTSLNLDYDAAVTAPTVSAPDGYVFDYWKNGAGTKVETIPNATADATYTAVYKYATYTISFKYKNADGDKTDITAIENVAYKTAFSTLTGIPSSETMNGKDYRPVGKKFTGWTIDDAAVTSSTTMPAKAVTLVAAYQDDSYSYSFVLSETVDETEVSGTATGATGTATYGGTIVAPTVSNITTGYEFVEWRDAEGEKVTTFSMNAEGVTYYAHYQEKTMSGDDATKFIGDGEWQQTTSGKYFEEVCEPDEEPEKNFGYGYEFVGWSLTPSTSEDDCINITNYKYGDKKTFYAVFVAKSFNVVFDANSGTYKDGTTIQATVLFGDTITAPEEVPEKTGYDFLGYNSNPMAKTAITLPKVEEELTGTKEFFAIWKEKYIDNGVSFDAVGGEYENGDKVKTISGNYFQPIEVPEEPEMKGYKFLGWTTTSGSEETEDIESDIIGMKKTYYAVYTERTDITLTFIAKDGTPITFNNCKFGEDIEVPIEEFAGYVFQNITGNDNIVLNGQISEDGKKITVKCPCPDEGEVYTLNYVGKGTAGYYFKIYLQKANAAGDDADEYYDLFYTKYITGTPAGSTVDFSLNDKDEFDGYTYNSTMSAPYSKFEISEDGTTEFRAYYTRNTQPEEPSKTGKITFMLDGEEHSSTEIKYGAAMPNAPVVSKDNMNFIGWKETTDNKYYDEYDKMPEKDLVFEPEFENMKVKLVPVLGSTTMIERDKVVESYQANCMTDGELAVLTKLGISVYNPTNDYNYDTENAVADNNNFFIYGLKYNLKKSEIGKYFTVSGNGHINMDLIDDEVGSGTVIEVIDDNTGKVVERLYVVILGDINGDGTVQASDSGAVQTEINGQIWSAGATKENWRLKAADVNFDGGLSVQDLSIIRKLMTDSYKIIDQRVGYTNTSK